MEFNTLNNLEVGPTGINGRVGLLKKNQREGNNRESVMKRSVLHRD